MYVDPWLASDPNYDPTSKVKQIQISALTPFGGLLEMPIYNIMAVDKIPANRKQAYILKWFGCPDDVQFEQRNPIYPYNPRRMATVPAEDYIRVAAPDGQTATAMREPKYSWSFAITGRPLQPHPTLPQWEPGPGGDIRIFVFNRRGITKPTVVRACMYDNCSGITLCWPAGPRPSIVRGQFLVEYTHTGARDDGTPVKNQRRAMTFHRIAAYDDPVGSGSDVMQVVWTDKPVSDYPIKHSLGDRRPLPDNFPSDQTTWPVDPDASANRLVWVPMVVFDGLIEVFRVRAE